MAELATLARPYAEALFQVTASGDPAQAMQQLDQLAAVAASPEVLQFADHPKVTDQQVVELVASAVGQPLSAAVQNLLRTVVENRRLSVLGEMAQQFRALVNQRAGVSEATVYSAFPIDDAALAEVVGTLERRFARKLNATVQVDPSLIGGIRVVVGDEVLDTSVKARLEQMKVALIA